MKEGWLVVLPAFLFNLKMENKYIKFRLPGCYRLLYIVDALDNKNILITNLLRLIGITIILISTRFKVGPIWLIIFLTGVFIVGITKAELEERRFVFWG